ncbi:HbrB-like protein, partial [Chytriomyces sp. MP71]
WRELRSRVLPLFNGEGLKGSIEELNDAVVDWLNESTLRSSSIRQDVIELATSGVLILNKRMVISGEETLLPRVLDLWSFFFGTIVPYVQGV